MIATWAFCSCWRSASCGTLKILPSPAALQSVQKKKFKKLTRGSLSVVENGIYDA